MARRAAGSLAPKANPRCLSNRKALLRCRRGPGSAVTSPCTGRRQARSAATYHVAPVSPLPIRGLVLISQDLAARVSELLNNAGPAAVGGFLRVAQVPESVP